MADNNAPRPLDKAPRAGGLYYTSDGRAVDANGNVLENAPERKPDTPEHEQPYARMVAAQTVGAAGAPAGSAAFDARAMGQAIADGLMLAGERAKANQEATTTAADAQRTVADAAENAKPAENTPPVGDSSRATAPSGATPAAPATPTPASATPAGGAASAGSSNTGGGK